MWLIQNVQNVNFTVTKIEDGLTIHTKNEVRKNRPTKLRYILVLVWGSYTSSMAQIPLGSTRHDSTRAFPTWQTTKKQLVLALRTSRLLDATILF